MKKKRSILLPVIAVAAAAVFFVSGWQVFKYVRGSAASNGSMDALREYVEEVSAEEASPAEEVSSDPVHGLSYRGAHAPVRVDFDVLQRINPDIAAWLYCKGTNFNHPVMYSGDNDFYLDHATDRSYNSAGSLFIDFTCSRDFSDELTVIYGHNMLNKSMFGKLPNFADLDYYEKASEMYLLTPDHDYQVELLARGIVSEASGLYALTGMELDPEQLAEVFPEGTLFRADTEFRAGDHYVLLSTCSYEYNGARFIVLGRLIDLNGEAQ